MTSLLSSVGECHDCSFLGRVHKLHASMQWSAMRQPVTIRSGGDAGMSWDRMSLATLAGLRLRRCGEAVHGSDRRMWATETLCTTLGVLAIGAPDWLKAHTQESRTERDLRRARERSPAPPRRFGVGRPPIDTGHGLSVAWTARSATMLSRPPPEAAIRDRACCVFDGANCTSSQPTTVGFRRLRQAIGPGSSADGTSILIHTSQLARNPSLCESRAGRTEIRPSLCFLRIG